VDAFEYFHSIIWFFCKITIVWGRERSNTFMVGITRSITWRKIPLDSFCAISRTAGLSALSWQRFHKRHPRPFCLTNWLESFNQELRLRMFPHPARQPREPTDDLVLRKSARFFALEHLFHIKPKYLLSTLLGRFPLLCGQFVSASSLERRGL
jgi:hypothetical protein